MLPLPGSLRSLLVSHMFQGLTSLFLFAGVAAGGLACLSVVLRA